ncbi:MAG: hypothetical protein B6226_03100 [Candidatus Cloacimonetes bacterium 4572_65]|nr:MAG: hypothetical protein B6226_03100 [Candidatus Cloacimonetes bacterium 4572_65]
MKNIRIITSKLLKYKVNLILGLVTMVLFAIFSGATITLLAPMFDYVFTNLDRPVVYETSQEIATAIVDVTKGFLGGDSINIFNKDTYSPLLEGYQDVFYKSAPLNLLYLVMGVILVALLFKNFFYVVNKYSFSALRAKSVRDIRDELFESYMNQSLAFFNQNRVVSLLIVPLFTWAVGFLGKKIKKYAKRIQEQASNLFSNIEEVLSSMKIVKSFSREEYELERMHKINCKYMGHWIKSQIYSSYNVPLSEMTSMLTGMIVIVLGANMIVSKDNSFSLGSFTAFLAAIFSILHPLKTLTKAYTNLRKANVSLDRIAEVIFMKPEIENDPQAVTKSSFDSKIEIKSVNFSYVEGKKVLNNVSMTFNKGESVGLVGSSGSGKSTIINLINRMYDFQDGNILIDGVDVKKIEVRSLRKLFGFVTQESILFSDTIANNIRYGSLDEVSDDDVKVAADIAYAKEFIEDLELGYDHPLKAKGSDLSGGQKQRICIARAIVGNPPILVFDEATSALDTDSENNVQIAIDKATENRTVIMIAHRLSTILKCDKIVVMDKGQVVGIGRHEELLLSCERYAELYRLQFNK